MENVPLDQIELLSGEVTDSKSIPTGQDIYCFTHALHEYEDGKAIEILKNIRQAMGTHLSKLLIVEWLPEYNGKDDIGLGYDLWMIRHGAGKIRPAGEFEVLLKASGFKSLQVVPSNIPQLAKVMEAVPVE